ncbi:MAG: response regulator [Proteobacteria bacterium]|nr:response regulator [Pseudomonadota bacterium]
MNTICLMFLTIILSCPNLSGQDTKRSLSTDDLIKIAATTNNSEELVISLAVLAAKGISETKIITPFSSFLKSNPIIIENNGTDIDKITAQEKDKLEQEILVTRYKEWMSDNKNIYYSPEANKIFYSIFHIFGVEYNTRWQLAKSDKNFPELLELLHRVPYKNIFISVEAWEKKDAQPTLLDKCMYYLSDFVQYPLAYICPEMPVVKPVTVPTNMMREVNGNVVRVAEGGLPVINNKYYNNPIMSLENKSVMTPITKKSVAAQKKITVEDFENNIKKWRHWHDVHHMPEDKYYMEHPTFDISGKNVKGIRKNYDLMKGDISSDIQKHILQFKGSSDPRVAKLVSEAEQIMNDIGELPKIPRPTAEIQTATVKASTRRPYNKGKFFLDDVIPDETINIKGRRVLVIEDEHIQRTLYLASINKYLKPLGIEVDLVETAEEALSFAKSKHYDIIFTDRSMPLPHMDGYTFTSKIREEGINSLIIDLSAWGKDPVELYRIGYDGCVSKPVKLNEIIKKAIQHYTGEGII